MRDFRVKNNKTRDKIITEITSNRRFEQGDAEEVRGIEDVRCFFMVLRLKNQKIKRGTKISYRLFVIGKKSLPEIRKSEASLLIYKYCNNLDFTVVWKRRRQQVYMENGI
jgi:hypothetical protein